MVVVVAVVGAGGDEAEDTIECSGIYTPAGTGCQLLAICILWRFRSIEGYTQKDRALPCITRM